MKPGRITGGEYLRMSAEYRSATAGFDMPPGSHRPLFVGSVTS
jgi:hypothetical protein